MQTAQVASGPYTDDDCGERAQRCCATTNGKEKRRPKAALRRRLVCGREVSAGGRSAGGGEEGEPRGPVVLRDIVIAAEQLAANGRNQGNNLSFWEFYLEPIDHFLSRLLGSGVADDKYIDMMNGGQSIFRGLVVIDGYDFVAQAAKQFGACA